MLNFHWTLIQLTHKKKELSLNLKQNQEILFNITLLCFKKKQQPFKLWEDSAYTVLDLCCLTMRK